MCAPFHGDLLQSKNNNEYSLYAHITLLIFDNAKIVLLIFLIYVLPIVGEKTMAIFHMSAQTISRSKGHSSVAAAAYRHGEKMTDEHTGEIHDYSKKKGSF